jgi:hypothetical protein
MEKIFSHRKHTLHSRIRTRKRWAQAEDTENLLKLDFDFSTRIGFSLRSM